MSINLKNIHKTTMIGNVILVNFGCHLYCKFQKCKYIGNSRPMDNQIQPYVYLCRVQTDSLKIRLNAFYDLLCVEL